MLKGILLAGGTGSRLSPLTRATNKHLLPVGRKPMILHPLGKLTEAGIEDIMVITGIEHAGSIVNLLGSGKEYGCKITYRVQDEAGGIAQALGLCDAFAYGSKVCVILGDNIYEDSLVPFAEEYEKGPDGAMILLKEVPDAHRFGVATLSDDKTRVVKIVEKPKQPETALAVTGCYFYDHVAFQVVKTLKPSGRGELEITDVSNYYIECGKMRYKILSGQWTDAGTFDSLARANNMVVSGASTPSGTFEKTP